MDLSKFTAEDAKRLSELVDDEELQLCLSKIHTHANNGNRKLHVYSQLLASTLNELKSRGFTVRNTTMISIQKDNLYHTIEW